MVVYIYILKSVTSMYYTYTQCGIRWDIHVHTKYGCVILRFVVYLLVGFVVAVVDSAFKLGKMKEEGQTLM